jgi:hypothetical protein
VKQADALAVGDGRVRVRRPPDVADGAGTSAAEWTLSTGEMLAGEARRRTVFVDGGRPHGERAAQGGDAHGATSQSAFVVLEADRLDEDRPRCATPGGDREDP